MNTPEINNDTHSDDSPTDLEDIPFDEADQLLLSPDDLDNDETLPSQPTRELTSSEIHPNRKTSRPPPVAKQKPNMHLYDYLRLCDPPLDEKIIDIACAETQVPLGLRKEARQEIRATWVTNKPNLTFQTGQIASYAHRIARQTCLRVRRDLGSAVRIPASAFRKDAPASALTPGLLAPSLDYSELESWMCMERTAEASFGEHALLFGAVEISSDDNNTDDLVRAKTRLAMVQNIGHILTNRQSRIMEALIMGAELPEIAHELQVPMATIRNELAIVTDLLTQASDDVA